MEVVATPRLRGADLQSELALRGRLPRMGPLGVRVRAARQLRRAAAVLMPGPAQALVAAVLLGLACSKPTAPPDRPEPPAPHPDVAAFEPFCPRPLTDPPRLVVERPC